MKFLPPETQSTPAFPLDEEHARALLLAAAATLACLALALCCLPCRRRRGLTVLSVTTSRTSKRY